ncbi:MAG: hypothetical protein HY702_07690 [Gemmatimonadetes bacterium]|nr:hypothetical protein [Gemmatimonadota bacterium]
MERADDGRLLVVTDSSFLIDFLVLDRMDILGGLSQFRFLLYDEFRRFLGDGESASLAVAVSRRWVIAADEKGRFRRELFARLGEKYLLDTAGALVTAIRAGAITTALAETLRARLRENRFEMDPRPFDELVKEE